MTSQHQVYTGARKLARCCAQQHAHMPASRLLHRRSVPIWPQTEDRQLAQTDPNLYAVHSSSEQETRIPANTALHCSRSLATNLCGCMRTVHCLSIYTGGAGFYSVCPRVVGVPIQARSRAQCMKGVAPRESELRYTLQLSLL